MPDRKDSLFLSASDIAWAEARAAQLLTNTPASAVTVPGVTTVATRPGDRIRQLQSVLSKLSPRDQEFARNLLVSFNRWSNLSAKQWPYVTSLIEKALTPESAAATSNHQVQLGDFAAVIALFHRAGQKLKWPKVRLLMADGTPVVLSLSGAGSSAPGTVNVAGEGRYPDRAWYGRITPAGAWQPARTISIEMLSRLAELLASFGQDPDSVAAAYGRATNQCCFCQRELTDARSVAAGYGPVCAANYGLKDAWTVAAMQGTQGGVLA